MNANARARREAQRRRRFQATDTSQGNETARLLALIQALQARVDASAVTDVTQNAELRDHDRRLVALER